MINLIDVEEKEPLLNGCQYIRTRKCPSKRIEKRLLNNYKEFCFKEFSNNITSSPIEECQIEIRRQILHHNVQSANVLVNGNNKVKLANFGLSRKFSDITRNISHNLENVRYMAPEKLENSLLWEIAELKKPHSDIDRSEILVNIRTRIRNRYRLPFSYEVPMEWIYIVSRAMEYEPEYRISISDICRDLYKLSRKLSNAKSISLSYVDPNSGFLPYNNVRVSTLNDYYRYNRILSVDDAIHEHKSKNGNKQLAWQSFKYHSTNNDLAKYM
ncbi:10428_t:CDS:2 [Rhizophagus irregularis]|nr:10428_t:CDS:2 [Rhizophagus irregularis]